MEIKIRDTHHLGEVLTGACEITSPLDDIREKDEVFLSRPLRLATVSVREEQAFDEGMARFFRAGFSIDLDRAIGDYERNQGRNPGDN